MPFHEFHPMDVTRRQRGEMKPSGDVRYVNGKGSGFQWKKNPEGIFVLDAGYLLITRNFGTEDVMTHHPMSKSEWTAKGMREWIEWIYPEFPAIYQYHAGVPLSDGIVYDRFHKMWYYNDGSPKSKVPDGVANFRISDEHPKRHVILRESLAYVDQVMRRGFWTPKATVDLDLEPISEILRTHGSAINLV